MPAVRPDMRQGCEEAVSPGAALQRPRAGDETTTEAEGRPDGSRIVSIDSIGGAAAFQSVGGVAPPREGRGPFQAVSSLLGMSADDIAAQVGQGKSLDDIASSKGVSHADLISAIQQGMPGLQASGADGSAIAERIAERKGLPHPHHHHGGPPPSGASGDGSASGVLTGTVTQVQQTMLDKLSSLLGTDSSSLLDQLKSGANLSDLASAKGIGGSSLASVLQDGLLFDATA